MPRELRPAMVHQLRMWSGRACWLSAAVALFVPVRVSFIGFNNGGLECGVLPWRSIVTLWHPDPRTLCADVIVPWLTLGRVAVAVAVLSAAIWRFCYQRDIAVE